MTGVTVGFDGSYNAYRALEWAMGEAALRHAPLTVMTVPTAYRAAFPSSTGTPVVPPPEDTALVKARQAAEDAVAKATSELGEASPFR